jgi:transcriptional regulator with GAF, ATPase, and Fis domain
MPIQAESETGKKLLVRGLQNSGMLAHGTFVTFHCLNLIEPVAESQPFAHVNGAFPMHTRNHYINFRSSNGGTLFMDAIGGRSLRLEARHYTRWPTEARRCYPQLS